VGHFEPHCTSQSVLLTAVVDLDVVPDQLALELNILSRVLGGQYGAPPVVSVGLLSPDLDVPGQQDDFASHVNSAMLIS